MVIDRRTDGNTDDVDRLARLLSDERRRLALAVLAEAGGPVSLGTLARLVARREMGREGGRVDDLATAVEISLYHRDVPKLDGVDLVDWDRERDVVRPGAALEDALPLVEAIAAARRDDRSTPDRRAESSDPGGHSMR